MVHDKTDAKAVLTLPAHHEASLSGWPRFTPAEALGPLLQEQVILGERTFSMWRPAEPDLLLEHPATVAAFAQDEYMPYWCDLWPASRMLAKALLQQELPAHQSVLELGCGLGMAGIAALARGCHVVFSDYDATALRFAAANALHHQFDQFELLPLNWCQPPERTFDWIIAADLLYEVRSVVPVAECLAKMLAPYGVVWITDQDRSPAPVWKKSLEERGWSYRMIPMHAGQPAGPGQVARRVKGTLYQIQRTAQA